LGKTISGEPYICDLAAMPHLLIAGTTGSGKSVCLNSVICSILFRMEPEKVKMVMVDPKRVELNVYQAIPHLLAPVVCEPRKAAAALNWAIEEMEDRYKKLASLGVRNIDGYNAIVKSKDPHPKAIGRKLEYMSHIVIVIDELADLMIIAKNEVEDSIIRLAQMSRAVGMHLILATQRPSVNVITGIIKANFPSRVAFQVSSKVDSRTILDTNGAESLLGRGDMLFSPGGSPKPIRLQGCYLSDQEVERLADWVRSQARANYVKTDFLTQQEIEEQRMKQSQEMNSRRPASNDDDLRMNGIDADDGAVMQEEGGDDYDYSYQQQRRDGRDVKEMLSGGGSSRPSTSDDSDAIDDELFRQAAKLILVHRKASVSLLQRKLKIGFARAGRVMDMLEEEGIVGPNVGSKVREILVDPDEYLANLEAESEEKF
jgi:S-DNA-T family DNA segregation ATPase FtsK/SpoIIIE